MPIEFTSCTSCCRRSLIFSFSLFRLAMLASSKDAQRRQASLGSWICRMLRRGLRRIGDGFELSDLADQIGFLIVELLIVSAIRVESVREEDVSKESHHDRASRSFEASVTKSRLLLHICACFRRRFRVRFRSIETSLSSAKSLRFRSMTHPLFAKALLCIESLTVQAALIVRSRARTARYMRLDI